MHKFTINEELPYDGTKLITTPQKSPPRSATFQKGTAIIKSLDYPEKEWIQIEVTSPAFMYSTIFSLPEKDLIKACGLDEVDA